MKYRLVATIVWVFIAVGFLPTSHSADGPSTEGVAYFEKHIRLLLVKRCYSCHSTGSKKQEGGLLLDSRDGWNKGGDSGRAVVPGKVDASLLIRAVRYNDPNVQMPPDKQLSNQEIALLEQWVRIVSPDLREAESIEAPQEDPSDPIAGRLHWAFRPLADSRPPIVKAADWPGSVLDSYVLAKLESVNLMPPEEDADRRTLARRVYVKVTGLPPTPQQMEAYLGDTRPDAYERLVDELLASSQFGERWGRHWLDLGGTRIPTGWTRTFFSEKPGGIAIG